MTPRQSQKPPWDEVCEQFRRLLKTMLIRLGAARLVVFALAALAVLMFLDWRLRFGTAPRLMILLMFLTGVVLMVRWELRRHLRRPWNDAEVLRYLDSLRPEGEDALLVLHELHHGDGVVEAGSDVGRDFLERAAAELDPALSGVSLPGSVRRTRVRRWELGALGIVLAAALMTGLFSEHVGRGLLRFFNPFTTLGWPQRTFITVLDYPEEEDGWTVAQGRSLIVRATVTGQEVPPEVTLYSRSAGADKSIPQQLPVREGAVEYTFLQINEDLRLYFEGGDAETETFSITVIPAPQLVQVEGIYTYPGYTGRRSEKITGGDVRALENTRVKLTFTSSVDLANATIQFDDDAPETVGLTAARTFDYLLALRKSGSYQIRLRDPHGLSELRPEKYDIDVIPDEPPFAEVIEPRRDLVATPRASLRVGIRVTDDFGLERVQFLHAVGDEKPTPLTDHITGPIAQTGLNSAQTFSWDLSKMGYKPPVRVTYYVYAKDLNPAGTGIGESRRFQIEVVKPSQFHLQLFQQAKAILTEARLAYLNQKAAYRTGLTWDEAGQGELDDPTWGAVTDTQRRSERAASRMKSLMQDLNRQIERNRMAEALCTGRLNVVAGLVETVVAKHHPAVRTALRAARPRTNEQAMPEALRTRRGQSLKDSHDDQKMAALALARILRKLYDWRDLQNSYIQATLLAERQDEITKRTETVAPEYIGKEIYDLTDAQVDRLMTLGNWQKAIFESETALEQELMQILRNAEERGRIWIRAPIEEAFGGLRNGQVNEKMKDAWLKIKNNQPFMITKQQRQALLALEEVRAGLEVAGKLVEKDRPIDLAMALRDDDLELTAKKVEDEVDPTEDQPTEDEVAAILARLREERRELPLGDALDLAVAEMIDLQDAVLKRTQYLDANHSSAEMPRFIRLKLGRLSEKQVEALGGADKAIGLADKAEDPEPKAILRNSRGEMQGVQTLLKRARIGKPSQQIQADLTGGLRDLRGMLSRQNEVKQRFEEHTRSGGMDAFKRKYVLREKDLELAAKVARACDHAHVLQSDVYRKARRLMTESDTYPAEVKRVEATHRATATARQKAVLALLTEAEKHLAGFSEEVAPRVRNDTPLVGVIEARPDTAPALIQAGNLDETLVTGLSSQGEALRDVVRKLLFLMDERVEEKLAVKPPTALTTQPVAEPITDEEFLASITPEALTKAIEESGALTEPLRQRMIESLKYGLNPKYKRLLGAYYAALARHAKKAAEKEDQGGQD